MRFDIHAREEAEHGVRHFIKIIANDICSYFHSAHQPETAANPVSKDKLCSQSRIKGNPISGIDNVVRIPEQILDLGTDEPIDSKEETGFVGFLIVGS